MKKVFYLVIITILLFINMTYAKADQNGIVAGTGVRLRKEATSSSDQIVVLTNGRPITILETVKSNDRNCGTDYWYRVNYESHEGYVCGEFVTIIYDIQDGQEAKDDYEKLLKEAGFPSSYWPYLKALHEKHPNWQFKPLNTNLRFDLVATKESRIGISLIDGNEGYRSVDNSVYNYYTNKWKALDGNNWYAVNKQTVEYYIDPRNFLTETSIFMFEDLSYNPEYHNKSMVENILKTTKLKDYDSNYAEHFMSAASSYKVSPVYLASRVRQEIGTSTLVISGASFTYNSKNYSNLYNPYNIGATSGADNWKKGLVWANGGQIGSDLSTSHLRPWNTLEKAIKGGASFLASGYINEGQNTNYLQRFNVANGESKVGSHQYMTNIRAPYSESSSTYSSYKKYGILDEPLVFSIPIYIDMPDKTTLPKTGNPNNYLKELKINNEDIFEFDGAKTEYTIYVPMSTTSIDVSATKVVNSGNISGTGKIKIESEKTVHQVVVTAQNGSVKTYNINIIKNKDVEQSIENILENSGYNISKGYINNIKIGTSINTIISDINNKGGNISFEHSNKKENKDIIATGDIIKVSNGKETKTYTIVVQGDSNGDGKINSQDYVNIKREILKGIKVEGYYRLAGDVNNDGKISSVDYVNIKNYILGKKSIIK